MRSGIKAGIAAGTALVGAATAGLVLGTTFAAGPAAAQGLVFCANEGEWCNVPYPTTLVYGARGRTTSRPVQPGRIACNNVNFGDPARGQPKTCSLVARAGGGGGFGGGGGGYGGGDYGDRRPRRDFDDYDRPRRPPYDGGGYGPRRFRGDPDDE